MDSMLFQLEEMNMEMKCMMFIEITVHLIAAVVVAAVVVAVAAAAVAAAAVAAAAAAVFED